VNPAPAAQPNRTKCRPRGALRMNTKAVSPGSIAYSRCNQLVSYGLSSNRRASRRTTTSSPAATSAAMKPPGLRKKIWPPARDQAGSLPPSTEMRVRRPAPGNRRAYTSERPVSSEAYATHRPSCDNAGACSTNRLATKSDTTSVRRSTSGPALRNRASAVTS
jgi:hypothetical protein